MNNNSPPQKKKLDIGGTYLNTGKAMHNKPIANTTLNGKDWALFLHNQEEDKGAALISPTPHSVQSLS